MSIQLDHMIVPVRDKEAAARFFARIFGLSYDGPMGPFAPVRVGSLTLDFDSHDAPAVLHYAFKVDQTSFDAIFGRIKEEGLRYGSGPFLLGDMRMGRRGEGRALYFKDLDGHILEILTR
ncbi:MAG: VOC family protein [Alphaproteobacteria bacterium]